MYGRELVDLRKESRWEFLNTLFSVSEAVAYMQVLHSFSLSYYLTILGVNISIIDYIYDYVMWFVLLEALIFLLEQRFIPYLFPFFTLHW